MCDYPFFIPQVVLFANSSLFWFKVTNEHREFRNYLYLLLFATFKRISLIRLKQQIRHRKTKAHDQCQQKCLHTSDQTCNGIS